MIKGLSWIGSKQPEHFEAMAAFLKDTLGLPLLMDQDGALVFEMANGDAFEIFKPSDDDHDFFSHPVAGLLVDDVDEARLKLEAAGVEFIGDIHRGEPGRNWGSAWSHFRAPDGNLYVLVSRAEANPGGSRRRFRELRVCLRVKDVDEALRLYRDVLGLAVVDEWTHPGGQRGALLAVAPTAIELFDDDQWDFVDEYEVGAALGTDHALRLEVDDLDVSAGELASSGVAAVGHKVTTPWEQDCVRATIHDGIQLTLCTLPEDERAVRAAARRRLGD